MGDLKVDCKFFRTDENADIYLSEVVLPYGSKTRQKIFCKNR